MSNLNSLIASIEKLEKLVDHKLCNMPDVSLSNEKENNSLVTKVQALEKENHNLVDELNTLKKDYQILKTTSQEVINELNNSIQVIEDYFKKQNANN